MALTSNCTQQKMGLVNSDRSVANTQTEAHTYAKHGGKETIPETLHLVPVGEKKDNGQK